MGSRWILGVLEGCWELMAWLLGMRGSGEVGDARERSSRGHLAGAARHLLAVGPRGEGGAAAHVLEHHLEELLFLVLVVVVDRQRHVLRRLVVACGVSGMRGEYAAWDAGWWCGRGEVCEQRQRPLSPKTSVPVDDL